MNLTPLDDVLDKHFGKVGTPKRDAFESDVNEALHAYRLHTPFAHFGKHSLTIAKEPRR